MNFFWLDASPETSAIYTVDSHVVKLPLEACQCMATAYPKDKSPYKHSHVNHPLCIWSRESMDNWQFLWGFSKVLFAEYTYRYNRRHKSEDVLDWMKLNLPPIESKGMTKIPRCFGEYRATIVETDNVYNDYRQYMLQAKTHLFKWSKREVPNWICIDNKC
jgi:hypothetical protein